MKKLDISGTQSTLPIPAEPDKLKPKERAVVEISETLEFEREHRLWTSAIACARDVAMACLPRKRTDEKVVKKSITFGPDCVVTVKYSVPDDCEMPFGADRFVFFGIQHLARKSNNPLVRFEKAGQLLEMFGISDGGREYQLLRDRFERLKSLNIEIETRGTQTGPLPPKAKWGTGSRLIEEWQLPTRGEIEADRAGQGSLLQELDQDSSAFWVRLSESLFNRVQKGNPQENILLLRLDLLKLFKDSPIGWDFCVFLCHRCGSARRTSVVPHDVLMEFFKAGKEADRKTIERLQKIHDQIQKATNGALNSELVVVKEERKGRGRPRKIWGLKVGPSRNVVLDGKGKFLPPAPAALEG